VRVNEVMTKTVECIRPDASIQEGAERMKALAVGALPVCANFKRQH
jgi:CBS domain-containing protein